MSLDNTKITEEQISINGISSVPDKLTGSASENKALFDRLVRSVVAKSFNDLVDILKSPEGASALGAKFPEGDSSPLQDVLNYAVLAAEEAQENAQNAIDIANAASGVDLSNYVKKTDTATYGGPPGVISLFENTNYGIGLKNDCLAVMGASEKAIDGKASSNSPITTKFLDYAIKVGVTTNINKLTNADKSSAQEFLGFARIHEGQYQGAGENQTNPSKIPCPFKPQLVIVMSVWAQDVSRYKNLRVMELNGKLTVGETSTSDLSISCSMQGFDYADGIVSWHDTAGVIQQCSVAGAVYRFVCVG